MEDRNIKSYQSINVISEIKITEQTSVRLKTQVQMEIGKGKLEKEMRVRNTGVLTMVFISS